jgi:HTH-type transcriptional regulator/antitoxin HigA
MATKNMYEPQIAFHPGETLAEKLEEMNMGPKEFALRANKPEKTITALLKGESAITADMAVQFEQVLQIPASFWLTRQRKFDEFIAREKRKSVIANAIAWAKVFPLKQLETLSWIQKRDRMEDKVEELFSFFGIASDKSWEDYYLHSELKVQFRISLAHTNNPYALSAWLRKGEIQAVEHMHNPYDEKKFLGGLSRIKAVMAAHPDNFFQKLQAICLESGVVVVHTPCLPKAPINGATRWLNDTPLIQLSGRYKRNDAFWFTFFHEAGHILLHGKKDIFLEKVEYSAKDLEKEKEADDFAVKWTFSIEQETEMLRHIPFKTQDIIDFAQSYVTHPAIIIGRFQHKNLIPYSLGREFFKAVAFDGPTCE